MAGKEYRLSILVSGKDQGAASMLQGVGSSLGSLAAIAGSLITAGFLSKIASGVADIAKQSVLAASRVGELYAVNQILAENAGLAGDAVARAAEAVRGMGIEAGVSQEVIAKFIQNQLDITKASTLARIAQDAAVISGQNSTEALHGITQGLITLQPEVLRTYGLFVDSQAAYKIYAKEIGKTVEALTTQEKQQAFLNATLEKGGAIAGAYEAAMQSAGKQIRSWPRLINDVLVSAGTPFQDAFDKSAKSVSNVLNNLNDMVSAGGVFHPFLVELAAGADIAALAFNDFLKEVGFLKSNFENEREWVDPSNNPFDGISQWFQDIDWMGMFVDATELFKTWAESIDWQQVSDVIATGIDGIDWTTIGEKINTGFSNIFSGGGTLAEFDFTEIANQATEGFADMIIAALGGETTWAGVEAQWASNFEQLKIITSNKLVQTSFIAQGLAGMIGTTTVGQMAIALISGGMSIFNAIMSWVPQIVSAFQTIKMIFYNTFQQAVLQAVRALESMTGVLMTAVSTLISKVLSIIKPIIIKIGVDLPNFEYIASKIAEGMDLIRDALSGGGNKGTKGGKSTGGGNSGGGSSGGSGSGNGVPQLASGGIASGPRSGFPAILHGTEAVIPLNGGSVPVSLNSSGMGGGGGIVINFMYSPLVSTASQFEASNTLSPMIADVVRNELAKMNM